MKTKLIILVFLGFIVSNAQTISLNGKWKFKASNSLSESELLQSDFSNWDTMQVPGNWDTHEKYATYVGKGYYQKTLEFLKNGKENKSEFSLKLFMKPLWFGSTGNY